MDWYEIGTVVFALTQLVLALLIFYFSGKVLFVMYTMSPLYRGNVPFVPTTMKTVAKAFDLLNIQPGEKVLDLGSGDGRFVLYGAGRVRASFVGVELSTLLYLWSKLRTSLARKKGMVTILRKNYYDENFSFYNKLFFFNMPSELTRLKEKLEKEVRPGTLVASVMFPLRSKKFDLLEQFGHKDKEKLFLYKRVD